MPSFLLSGVLAPMIGRLRNVIACCGLMFSCLPWASAECQAQPPRGRDMQSVLRENHQQRYREFATQAEKLAKSCDEMGQDAGAETVRSRVIRPELLSHKSRSLPREVTPEIPNTLSQE